MSYLQRTLNLYLKKKNYIQQKVLYAGKNSKIVSKLEKFKPWQGIYNVKIHNMYEN